jgi:hypothetical protein
MLARFGEAGEREADVLLQRLGAEISRSLGITSTWLARRIAASEKEGNPPA